MEVPIAVPLRVPSSEARRRSEYDEEEEIDIGASVASSRGMPSVDLLGLSPPSDIPSTGRFQIGRPRDNASSMVIGSPQSIKSQTNTEPALCSVPATPWQPQASTSYDMKRNRSNGRPSGRKRGDSLTSAFFGGDDVEGDLGYAAAADMENATRKVIMERLETVKANNPVFSWC